MSISSDFLFQDVEISAAYIIRSLVILLLLIVFDVRNMEYCLCLWVLSFICMFVMFSLFLLLFCVLVCIMCMYGPST